MPANRDSRRRRPVAVLAASVFTVGVVSAPLRPCPHHGGGTTPELGAATNVGVPTSAHARHDGGRAHDMAHAGHDGGRAQAVAHTRHDRGGAQDDGARAVQHGSEHSSQHRHADPCTCLSHCDTGSAKPMRPPPLHLARHDPPTLEPGLPAEDLVLPRAPLPQILPFPNPPPLPA